LGSYLCEFEGLEPIASELYGPGLRWDFSVVNGKYKDRTCCRITGSVPSPKNACGRFFAALAGETPRDGLEVNSDDFVGHRYTVMIESTAAGDGSTRIATFAPISEDGEPETPAAQTGDIPF
jgi:hypothetical protein